MEVDKDPMKEKPPEYAGPRHSAALRAEGLRLVPAGYSSHTEPARTKRKEDGVGREERKQERQQKKEERQQEREQRREQKQEERQEKREERQDQRQQERG